MFPSPETYSTPEVGISYVGILNCVLLVFTNEKRNLIGVVESSNCTFCQDAESVEHLLFSSRISSDFLKHVFSWLRDNDLHVGTNESDVIFRNLIL